MELPIAPAPGILALDNDQRHRNSRRLKVSEMFNKHNKSFRERLRAGQNLLSDMFGAGNNNTYPSIHTSDIVFRTRDDDEDISRVSRFDNELEDERAPTEDVNTQSSNPFDAAMKLFHTPANVKQEVNRDDVERVNGRGATVVNKTGDETAVKGPESMKDPRNVMVNPMDLPANGSKRHKEQPVQGLRKLSNRRGAPGPSHSSGKFDDVRRIPRQLDLKALKEERVRKVMDWKRENRHLLERIDGQGEDDGMRFDRERTVPGLNDRGHSTDRTHQGTDAWARRGLLGLSDIDDGDLDGHVGEGDRFGGGNDYANARQPERRTYWDERRVGERHGGDDWSERERLMDYGRYGRFREDTVGERTRAQQLQAISSIRNTFDAQQVELWIRLMNESFRAWGVQADDIKLECAKSCMGVEYFSRIRYYFAKTDRSWAGFQRVLKVAFPEKSLTHRLLSIRKTYSMRTDPETLMNDILADLNMPYDTISTAAHIEVRLAFMNSLPPHIHMSMLVYPDDLDLYALAAHAQRIWMASMTRMPREVQTTAPVVQQQKGVPDKQLDDLRRSVVQSLQGLKTMSGTVQVLGQQVEKMSRPRQGQIGFTNGDGQVQPGQGDMVQGSSQQGYSGGSGTMSAANANNARWCANHNWHGQWTKRCKGTAIGGGQCLFEFDNTQQRPQVFQ